MRIKATNPWNKTNHPMHSLYGVICMKNEKNNSVLLAAVICGAVTLAVAMLVRTWAGAPYQGILQMGIGGVIPPVWLMALLWLGWYFCLGAVCGGVLAAYGRGNVGAWRGAVFFVLMIGLGFVWYPLFFVRHALFLCVLISLILIGLCLLCALNWQSLSLVAGAIFYLHALWLVYMLILQIVCIFHA